MKFSNSFKNLESISFNEGTILNEKEDFYNGWGQGIYINNEGEIVLEEKQLEGLYQSPIVNTKNFNDLICSWNGVAVDKSEIEIFIQIKEKEKWSNWLTYGKWWSNGNEGSVTNQKDNIALIDVDLVKVLGEGKGNGFRYKIKLKREEVHISSPKIRLIAIALNLHKVKEQTFTEYRDWEKELDLPQRSQMIVPEIGSVICSPTSLSMILEYYGHFEETVEVAKGVFDYGAKIYGNWTYNVAYAGTKGFKAYIARYENLDQIKALINKGIPLVASIRTKTVEELQGAPQSYPSGHLVAIRGFNIKDGIEYIIVNDPAALGNENVRKEYISSQFLKAWNGVVYCVFPK